MNKNFENFIATVVADDDKFFIVDWRHKDGESNYFVRYICDLKLGSLIINGDLGSCVANWHHKTSVEEFKEYINDIYYFIKKFECYTDRYYRSEEKVKTDLDNIKQDFIENECTISEAEIKEDFNQIEDFFLENNEEKPFYNPDILKIFEKYFDSWWDWEMFDDIGITIHPRVKLWVEGFNLAMEQLGR